MRLFHRLLVMFLPAMIFFLLLLGGVIQHVSQQSMLNLVERKLDSTAQLHHARLNDYLNYTRERLEAFNSRLLIRKILAAHPDGKLPQDKLSQLQKIVLGTKRLIESFEEIYLVSIENVVAASTIPELIGRPYSNLDILKRAKKSQVLAHVDYATNGELKLIHATKLLFNDKPIGYLVVVNHAQNIIALAEDRTGLGETGESYLVQGNHGKSQKMLYLSPLRFEEHAYGLLDLNDKLADMAVELRSDNIYRLRDYRGEKVIATTRRFDKTGWGLVVKIDEKEALMALQQLTLVVLLGSGVLALLLIAVSVFMARTISAPLENMAQTATAVEKGDFEQDFKSSNLLEVNFLAKVFNQMLVSIKDQNQVLEHQVSQRTLALQNKNRELNDSLYQLKEAQNKLIESEKMAALGSLVAGIAHEVNTPIGAAIGAATHLQEKVTTVDKDYNAGKLTEKSFANLLTSADAAMNIVTANLQRAAELISSFKRVAVDQSDEHLTTFNLSEYIKDVLTSLKPKYRQCHVTINQHENAQVQLHQCPGIFAQIVTNIVLNAATHAFDDQQTDGRIDVIINRVNDQVELTFSDNGCGMPSETVDRIFEPFFTTRRGLGGSGLGLHIVYNIVTQKLQGSINVISSPGEGTCFIILFPVNRQQSLCGC